MKPKRLLHFSLAREEYREKTEERKKSLSAHNERKRTERTLILALTLSLSACNWNPHKERNEYDIGQWRQLKYLFALLILNRESQRVHLNEKSRTLLGHWRAEQQSFRFKYFSLLPWYKYGHAVSVSTVDGECIRLHSTKSWQLFCRPVYKAPVSLVCMWTPISNEHNNESNTQLNCAKYFGMFYLLANRHSFIHSFRMCAEGISGNYFNVVIGEQWKMYYSSPEFVRASINY